MEPLDTQAVITQMKAYAKNNKEYATLAELAVSIMEGNLVTQATALENEYRDQITELQNQITTLQAEIDAQNPITP